MKINGLRFDMTSAACPEQYDVYDKEDNRIGYVRFRFGQLTCKYKDDKVVYSEEIGDEYTGCFMDDAERKAYLSKIADTLVGCICSDYIKEHNFATKAF